MFGASDKPRGKRPGRRSSERRNRPFEVMEERLLFTTVFGGEQFVFTDARGNTVLAQMNGNVTTELVSAVQSADNGSLIFGNISGTITTVGVNNGFNRSGTIIGDGSVPVTGDEEGGAKMTINDPLAPGTSYSTLRTDVPTQAAMINIVGISSDPVDGSTWGFNVFQVPEQVPNGNTTTTIQQTIIQLVQFNNTTGVGTVRAHLEGGQANGTDFSLPGQALEQGTYVADSGNISYITTAVQAIQGAAFNPVDHLLYFIGQGESITSGNSTSSGTGNSTPDKDTFDKLEGLYAIDVSGTTPELVPSPGVGTEGTDVPPDTIEHFPGNFTDAAGNSTITAMTWQSTGAETADLWVFDHLPSGTTTGNTSTGLLSFAYTDAGGTPTIDTNTPGRNDDPTQPSFILVKEGFVQNRPTVTSLTGLAFVPGDPTHIYATENTSAELLQIDITTDNGFVGAATDWGTLLDQYYQFNHRNDQPAPPTIGANIAGLTFNPKLTNPFTGQTGVLMATDATTKDLVYVDSRLRIAAGDIYQVYTTQSDINASETFQSVTLANGKFTSHVYTGNIGTFAPATNTNTPFSVPGATGGLYLGFLGNIPNGNNGNFTSGNPFLSGELDGAIGVLPSLYSTDASITPTNVLLPGLTVGNSLETYANQDGTLTFAQKLLGNNFNSVHGFAIARDGTMAVVNTDSFGGFGTGDQIALVNPVTGAISDAPQSITNSATGLPLSNIEGLAYGSVNIDGNEQLYAIYDLGDGNGPTLGTLDPTTGIFTAIGTGLGLGANAKVFSMAFSPNGTGADPTHQGLFVAVDTDALDGDPTQDLFQVDPVAGAAIGTSIGAITSPTGGLVDAGSLFFDAPGDLVAHDINTGELLNLNLDTTGATSAFSGASIALSAPGSINPTVGGIALDLQTNQYFAIDNATGTSEGRVNIGGTLTTSSALMVLGNFTQNATSTLNLGKFMFDGAVTGRVFVTGSMDTFYAGWLITGDAAFNNPGGDSWIGGGGATDTAVNEGLNVDNFQINGDIRNILSLASIGTDGTPVADADGLPTYFTSTDIIVDGKIGNVNSDGMIDAHILASNEAGVPGLGDLATVNGFGEGLGTGFQINGFGNRLPFTGLGSTPGIPGNTDILTMTSTLATDSSNEVTSTFDETPVSTDEFSTTFTYTATGTGDGFAFVLQNSAAGAKALGAANGGLGYKGIGKSVALVFNMDGANPGGDLGFDKNGVIKYDSTTGLDLGSGDPINVTISYDGSTLNVLLTDGLTAQTFQTSYAGVNLAALVGGHSALVGFTASSDVNGSNQAISNFIFNAGKGLAESEVQAYQPDTKLTADGAGSAAVPSFAFGDLVNNGGTAPFSNQSFATAQYLGSVTNSISGQSDVIHLNGSLYESDAKNALPGPDDVDYYAVSLMAGQTITVQLNSEILGTFPSYIGIFDADNRLIATDYADVDATQVKDHSITITADRAGTYRIAVGNTGNSNFTQPSSGVGGQVFLVGAPTPYSLTVTGTGNFGIGGVVAGGSIILPGDPNVNVGGLPTLGVKNSSIETGAGDIGAVVAGEGRQGTADGHSILSDLLGSIGVGLVEPTTSSGNYTLNPLFTPTQDIDVDAGNLRAVVAGSIGFIDGPTQGVAIALAPDISVANGGIGRLQTTSAAAGDVLFATMSVAAKNSVQFIDAAGELGGVYRTDQGFGVVDAGSMGLGTLLTEFHANVDNTGNDGIFDLIDVSGNIGINSLNEIGSGPAIITGLGGDVRFFHVSPTSVIYQDTAFGGNITGTDGRVTHAPGSVRFQDDSGAIITLNPSDVINPQAGLPILNSSGVATGQVQPNTIAGTLITEAYGIRGVGGGQALLDVSSNSGLSITSTGATNIGEIDVNRFDQTLVTTTLPLGPEGIPLLLTASGLPELPFIPDLNSKFVLPTILPTLVSISGNSRIDVYSVNDVGVDTDTLSTINSISNNTGGDILNVTGHNIGSIIVGNTTVGGSLGSTTHTATPQTLLPIAVFNNTYPFNDQRIGITAETIVSISAGKSVGNVLVTGGVIDAAGIPIGGLGSVTANTLGNANRTIFYGINGPIVVDAENFPTGNTTTAAGTVTVGNATIFPGLTATIGVSIGTINIGNGILDSGSGNLSFAGIYAVSRIGTVTGTNADIRGDIISKQSIGAINLTNGSIINAFIGEVTTFTSAQPFGELPTSTDLTNSVTNPFFNIGSITLTGTGGILGSEIIAANTGNVTVSQNGFGILDSVFETPGDGVVGIVSAGGYGLRDDLFDGANFRGLIATGNGTFVDLSQFESNVQPSIPSFASFASNNETLGDSRLTDLGIFINGDGTGIAVLSPSLDETGVIENITVLGHTIGNITAVELVGSTFNLDISTGNIKITKNISPFVTASTFSGNGTEFNTGSVASLTVGGNITDLDMQVAGQIGPVKVGGSVLVDTDTTDVITGSSNIIAKGPGSNIASIVVAGDFTGNIEADNRIGSITIGTAGTHGNAGTGNFDGTIELHGSVVTTTVIDLLKFFGSITGGSILLNGNVGTIDIAQDLANFVQDLVVNGNLAVLKVGSDPNVNGSTVGAPVTILGNLGTGTIVGSVSAPVTVHGNITSFTVTGDLVTTGQPLITNTGAVNAGGTISNLTVSGGSVAGNVIAGKNVTVTIKGGGLDAGGQVASSLGNVQKLTITGGSLAGNVLANNGAITAIAITGVGQGVADTSTITARSMGTLALPGNFAGTLNVVNALSSVSVGGDITSEGSITAGSIGSVKATGNIDGVVTAGVGTSTTSVTAGGNLSGALSFASAAAVAIGGSMIADSTIESTSNLNSLTVKGALSGDVLIDGTIGSIAAASVSGGVITSGLGITSVTVTGAFANSLLQVGLARGNDGVFGTDDLGEQARMADLGSLSVGTMTNSIVAAGGNIGTFKSKGTMTDSSVSSGIVLDGGDISDVINDGTPLANLTELNAARADATLLHGNFTSATVGAGVAISMFASTLSAGVSPGDDGDFGTAADNNVSSSVTGGISKFGSVKAVLDNASQVLANTAGTTVTSVITPVKYTLDGTANSIIQSDPLNSTQIVTTVLAGHTGTYTLNGQTITITVSGPKTASVTLYDNGSLVDGVADTLVIDGGGSASGVTVKVVTSTPGGFDLGRVLTTDGTVVSSFTFNGDINGDALGGPALYIDSDISTLSFRNMPNDATWQGMIGGNVGTLTIAQQGPGLLRIGGKVTTLKVGSSVGDPLLQQLGPIAVMGGLTQLAFDPNTSNVVGVDVNGNLLGVNVVTGAIGSTNVIHLPGSTGPLTLNGLTFDNTSTLFGVATINNLDPVVDLGSISDGDQLSGLAVNSQGVIYAVDTINDPTSGLPFDNLVTIDPTTGALTVIGKLRDAGSSTTYTNNVLALAFDANDNLLVLLNDQDGNGQNETPASGVAIGYIATSVSSISGFVAVSSPNTSGSVFAPVLLKESGAVITDPYTALAVDSSGQIWAVRHVGNSDELDQIAITGGGNNAHAAVTDVGDIQVSGADTQIVGMGFDENGNLVGLNTDATDNTTRELVSINITTTTTDSSFITAPGLIQNGLQNFALGKSGTNFKSYAYTTDPSVGGELFTNPGVVATLGTIATSGPNVGTFTELLPLASDDNFTPIAGTVQSIAVDDSGDVFVVNNTGILSEYNAVDGSIQNDGPLGQIRDNVTDNVLNITHLGFDDSGDLVAINAQQDRLVVIDTDDVTTVDGEDAVLASALTNFGSVDANDLTALTFSTDTGTFLSYSISSGNIVSILGTSPNELGGIVANSFGTVSLPGNFGGRVVATGLPSGNSISAVSVVGAGTFSGDVETAGSIGTLSSNGAIFTGSVLAGGNFGTATISGAQFATNGIVSAGGKLGTFTYTAPTTPPGSTFAGTVLAGSAGTITIKGSTDVGSLIAVNQTTSTVNITGMSQGTVQLNGVTNFTLTGLLALGSILISGDAGSVKLAGGTALGTTFLAGQGVTNLTIGATLAGTVGTRRSVGTLNVSSITDGVLAIGGDVNSTTIAGNILDSIITSGVWIGADGVYNTADDVVFGGTFNTVKVNGVMTDSIISAGVLPREGVDAGANNIPLDFTAFSGNPGAFNVADVNSAEVGGISASTINSITFLRTIITDNLAGGVFSGLVTADKLGTVKAPAASDFQKISFTNPVGAPLVATDANGVFEVTRASNGTEIDVVFNQQLDTATLNNDTISVDDGVNKINGLTFGYGTQAAPDGSTQGVLKIFNAAGFLANTSYNVNISSGVLDQTGPRSALFDFNQDGVSDASEDPFGAAATNTTYAV